MKWIKTVLFMLVILYILHELGHAMMYIIFGVPFECVLFPYVLGTYHLIGFVRPHITDPFVVFNVRFVGPILAQSLFVILVKKEPKWMLLGLPISYGDILISLSGS